MSHQQLPKTFARDVEDGDVSLKALAESRNFPLGIEETRQQMVADKLEVEPDESTLTN